MDIILYSLTGFAAAAIGALPPGAVNLSVVYTTINQGAKFTVPIILAAAFGEIVLSFFALHCTMAVEEYIQKNIIVQYAIAILLIIGGVFLFFQKKKQEVKKEKKKNNSFLKGLLLAILNPPVLVFWLVAFAYIAANTGVMVQMGLIQLVIAFFIGVFLGKIFTLGLYLQLSKRIAKRASSLTEKINKGIGFLLGVIGCIQLVKLLL